MKTLFWSLFIFLAVSVGLYPFAYLFFDITYGLLSSKSSEVLDDQVWRSTFYQHIFLGAVALLTGWSQFSKKIRNRNLKLHRTLGKIYLIAMALSGIAGLYICLIRHRWYYRDHRF